jgi:hypothetical protein
MKSYYSEVIWKIEMHHLPFVETHPPAGGPNYKFQTPYHQPLYIRRDKYWKDLELFMLQDEVLFL